MKGLDTNVLVRYLTQDDPHQAETARREIEEPADEDDRFLLSNVVLCEVVWVLESAYGIKRDEIVPVVERILRTHQFEFEDKDLGLISFAGPSRCKIIIVSRSRRKDSGTAISIAFLLCLTVAFPPVITEPATIFFVIGGNVRVSSGQLRT